MFYTLLMKLGLHVKNKDFKSWCDIFCKALNICVSCPTIVPSKYVIPRLNCAKAREIEREGGQLGPLFETAVGKRSAAQSGEKHTIQQCFSCTLWSNTLCGATHYCGATHCVEQLQHTIVERDWAGGPFGEHSYFGHTSRTRGGLGVWRMEIEESLSEGADYLKQLYDMKASRGSLIEWDTYHSILLHKYTSTFIVLLENLAMICF